MDVDAPPTTDDWLNRIDAVGRELVDVVEGIDWLDEMHAKGTSPTVGFMERNTRVKT
jgi:hypothetical protein